MSEPTFAFDVFLSHSSKDKATVRQIAERLRKDGLRIWFDEWQIRPGDSIPAKIEDGLQRSRELVLCLSKNVQGSDWTQMEVSTFRFRDPLNKQRRFIPLRLDYVELAGSGHMVCVAMMYYWRSCSEMSSRHSKTCWNPATQSRVSTF